MRTCSIHGAEIVWEEGGPDMPTTFGRYRCDACDDEFILILRGLEEAAE